MLRRCLRRMLHLSGGFNVSPLRLVKIRTETSQLLYDVRMPLGDSLSAGFALGPAGSIHQPVITTTVAREGITRSLHVLVINQDGTKIDRQRIYLPDSFANGQVAPLPEGGWWLAGTAGPGLPVSSDAYQREFSQLNYVRWEDGKSISPLGPMREPGALNSLLIDPADRNRIYATSSRGLFRSDDNGWNWQPLGDTEEFRDRLTRWSIGVGHLWMLANPPRWAPPKRPYVGT